MSATSSTSSSSAASELAMSGLASGIDWTSIVSEMLTEEAAPETQMTTEETTDQSKKAAYQTIGTDLTTLNKDVTTLSKPSFFETRTTAISDPTVASATAASGAALGDYTFKVDTMATDSTWVGATASAPISPTDDVSNLDVSSAGFATPVTAGTFTVNGQAITVTTGETLGDVFNAIQTQTSNGPNGAAGAVTGSYDTSTDTITLSSSGPITLGSDTDTSNFLQAAQLYNSSELDNAGAYTVTSPAALGGVSLTNTLEDANTAQQIQNGSSGSGSFFINGVKITYDATTDTLNDVLQQINDSGAGVTAAYDSLDNCIKLTNTTLGDTGVSLQNGTGNFLAATGLSAGTLSAGTNLTYNINGGPTLTSLSNTIDAGAAGLTGLSITALGQGTTTISVASDTTTISSAISSFVTDYNAVQNYISSQTTSSTSSTGTVTPGLLTGDMDVENIAFSLRQMVDATPPGGTTGVENLNDLGITSSGSNNILSISDTATLNSALTNNLSAIQNLFSNAKTGLATTVESYLGGVTGSSGVLATDETSMGNEATAMATSISTLQAKIAKDQTTLDNEFAAMETAIESINTDKQYLNDYFNSSSASDQSAPTQASSSSSTS
ncbi:MAG: flagellar filament capping protein FliD [Verrucomicrobiota bacterium]